MTVQTYCTTDDVEAVWDSAVISRMADDDHSGELSETEQNYISRAIEQGANHMNACLEMRYVLLDLAGNAWCRDANALLAACNLATRRGNPPPNALRQQFQQINRNLKEILQGRMKVPQVDESLEMTPTVTNFDTDMGRCRAKVRRVAQTSTGSSPVGKSFPE